MGSAPADLPQQAREETALESFVSGFQLAWGIAQELEARGLYSFDVEESERIRKEMEMEV